MNKELYEKYIDNNQLLEAYIVAKNAYSREQDNVEVFKLYFELATKLAMFDVDITERKNYLNEASNALALATDSIELNENRIDFIKECEGKIKNIYNSIISDEEIEKKGALDNILKNNNEELNNLAILLEKIKTVEIQKEFDECLVKVESVEEALSKEYFSEAQENSYQKLSKQYSKVVSQKIEEINHNELLEKNKKAISVYKKVFDTYVKHKDKYRDNESNLKALVYNSLFAFDTRDLFNESLIYYNHIYSMIFNEVDDKLKFKITEWSIESSNRK